MDVIAFLRRPYVLAAIALIVLADAAGVFHAYKSHGAKDGSIALIAPPYGLYRSVEWVMHKRQLTEEEIVQLSQSPDGRLELAANMMLKQKVWELLTALIAEQKTKSYSTIMEEGGVSYDITAVSSATGSIQLSIRGRDTTGLSVEMIDEDRDQEPETLLITREEAGKKPEVHTTPLARYGIEESSQFLLAWSLAWGTIAEELKPTAVTIEQ
jgi:hypothetical protein